jgi:hypothetical protein
MLGVWLALSPFFLGVGAYDRPALIYTFACAFLVVLASCLSYWEPAHLARVLTLGVGAWLAADAYAGAAYPAEPAAQNAFLVGLLLILFAIVPNEASRPPRTWRAYSAPPRRQSAPL